MAEHITAVMQPYFFPYIGYYQLLHAADTFVILDEVSFIKRGWINRNYLLINGAAHLVTLPLQNASQNRLIKDTRLCFPPTEKARLLKTVENAYRRAPQFEAVFAWFKPLIENAGDDLTSFLHQSLTDTLCYLQLPKTILRSSQLPHDLTLCGPARIIDLCRALRTTLYVNPIGGQALYAPSDFAKAAIRLRFINTQFEQIKYAQFREPFVPNLSFVDILMFNDIAAVKKLLACYTLIPGE